MAAGAPPLLLTVTIRFLSGTYIFSSLRETAGGGKKSGTLKSGNETYLLI